MNTFVYELGTLALVLAVLFGVLFLVLYTVLARWWESREGWYLFVSSFIFAEVLAYNYTAIMGWFDMPDPVVREWVRLIVYGQVLIVMGWRGILLLQATSDGYREQKLRQAREDSQIQEY